VRANASMERVTPVRKSLSSRSRQGFGATGLKERRGGQEYHERLTSQAKEPNEA